MNQTTKPVKPLFNQTDKSILLTDLHSEIEDLERVVTLEKSFLRVGAIRKLTKLLELRKRAYFYLRTNL